ncbi:putative C6 transcription factor [Aspergillus lucknowensis]|uniref:Zn(2)-C6 fungal-type domain-containing protein n=1 Tax=Aspergillus lucknowensis TaxID=176173 RepID=A0ABR4LE66_9EURO
MSSPKSRRLAPMASDSIPSNNPQKRRKNVGTACLGCKARKLKCSGAPPCANCVKSRLECNLDESTDRRRRGPLKRKIDQLEDKEDLFYRLIQILREGSNRRIVPLLNLIRSRASFPEIRFYIEHPLSRSELTQTAELVEVFGDIQEDELSEPAPKRRILDPRRSPEPPRFSVPAQPWTSVTVDDELVSRLITLWFTWVHPFCNWIDRDLFLRDMKSGSISAPYCSPFLVSIILANACAYADYSTPHNSADDLASKRTQFYEEAKRSLDKEEGRIRLPTVQGLGVLWICASITGRDRQGWISRGQLAYSLQELSLTSSNVSSHPDTLRMARVANHTSWGLFNLAMIYALCAKKVPVVKLPSQSPPFPAHHQCEQDEWSAYPIRSKSVLAHTSCLFSAVCNLNRIAYGLYLLLLPQEEVTLPRIEIENDKLEAIRDLSAWLDQLPSCVKEHNVDLPHVLSLHMYYHAVMVVIYGFFRFQPVYAAKVSASSPKSQNPYISTAHAGEICLSSARRIAQLTVVYRSNWGFDHMPGVNVHCMMTALLILLEFLDDHVNRDAFISLTMAAGAFTRRWGFTKPLLRNLQNKARERGVTLPPETGPVFIDLDEISVKSSPAKSETPEATNI